MNGSGMTNGLDAMSKRFTAGIADYASCSVASAIVGNRERGALPRRLAKRDYNEIGMLPRESVRFI